MVFPAHLQGISCTSWFFSLACRDFPTLHGFSRSPAGNFLHFMVFPAHLQGISRTSWFFSLACREFPALHGFSRSLAGIFPHFMVFLARLQGFSCTSWFFPLTCRDFHVFLYLRTHCQFSFRCRQACFNVFSEKYYL